MGVHFDKASRMIGRQRLPSGLVAILDDASALRGAINELHDYANNIREPNRSRKGIVFRVVDVNERTAIVHKLCDRFGSDVSKHDGIFCIPVGHWHLIDDSVTSHACNRHAITEGAQNHLLLTKEDFQRIPDVVNPRYIREFATAKNMPRIVYEREYDDFALVVVQEIQAKAGLAVKTAYRKR
jgi:hypothetical protein